MVCEGLRTGRRNCRWGSLGRLQTRVVTSFLTRIV
jgi:hypothetical protein